MIIVIIVLRPHYCKGPTVGIPPPPHTLPPLGRFAPSPRTPIIPPPLNHKNKSTPMPINLILIGCDSWPGCLVVYL